MTRREFTRDVHLEFGKALWQIYGKVDYMVVDVVAPSKGILDNLLTPNNFTRFSRHIQNSKFREIGHVFAFAVDQSLPSGKLRTSELIQKNGQFLKTQILLRINNENYQKYQSLNVGTYYDGVLADVDSPEEARQLLAGWQDGSKTRLCFTKNYDFLVSSESAGCDVKIGDEEILFRPK